jgi:hypothetical protein
LDDFFAAFIKIMLLCVFQLHADVVTSEL